MNLHTHCTEHLSANEFQAALADAIAGDTIVYARGRLSESLEKGKRDASHCELRLVAELALAWEQRRQVCLTQRRVGQIDRHAIGIFEYLAVKRAVSAQQAMPIRARAA
jgi:hypothetical protein